MKNSFRSALVAGILFTSMSTSFPQIELPRLLVPLSITDGTMTVRDTLGCDGNATYCIDGIIDTGLIEEELPMLDPLVFDARFIDHRVDTCSLGMGVRLHIQELGPIDTFRLSITPGGAGFPITLTWEKLYQGFVIWWELRIGKSGDDISTYTNMLTDTLLLINDQSMTTLDIIGRGDPFDDVESDYSHIPSEPALYQNYPNPFNPQTTIRYYIPSQSVVTLAICDILGRSVYENTRLDGSPGYHTVEFNAIDLAGGVYTYFLRTESRLLSRKFLYIK